MDKNFEISLLFDFYGEMLTDTQQEAVNLYYNDDLSLKETADILGMSRQGVRDALSRAKNSLYTFEEKLKLCARFSKTQQGLEMIIKTSEQLAQLCAEEKTIELASKINSTALKLYEQEV